MASSLEEMQPRIDTHLHNLKECNDFTVDLVSSLRKLSSMVLICSDPRAIGVYLIKEGLDEICLKMLTDLSKCLNDNKQESQSYLNLHHLLVLTLNITDGCREFGDALVARGCVSVLLTMAGICIKVRVNDLILGVLQNSIRMSANNRAAFRDAKAIDVLQPLLESDSTVIQTGALMILAYVVSEKEREILATSKSGLIMLIMVLNSAVKHESQRTVIEGTSTSFSVFETLDAINQLAINDTSKDVIVKQGAVPAIIRVLEDDFSDDDHRVAVEALWNLSFVESIRDSEILQSIIPTLEKLAKSSNKDLQRVCASTLWQIKGSKSENDRLSSTPRPSSYYEGTTKTAGFSKSASAKVMLSYQWDYQKRVLKLKERLEKDGYRVWMDISSMEGDILGAMAKAVEESDVILMCMSERYRDSKSCRSEATYAYKLEKKIIPLRMETEYKPDGWLGLLQGMDLYYACHSDEELDRSMPALLKVINESTPSRANDIVDGPITPMKQQTSHSSPPSGTPARASAADWSVQEVQHWLHEKKFKCAVAALDDFEGSDLQELYTQLVAEGDSAFKHELKSDLGMNALSLVRFTARLKKLYGV